MNGRAAAFLKLMGASMALAGFGLTSCRRPEAHLVPFTKSVEWAIPGKSLFYATAMPRRTGAHPARRHDARWPADQDRRQSAPSGQRRRDRRFRPGFDSRSLRSGALEAFRRKRREDEKGKKAEFRDARSRRVREISGASFARRSPRMAAPASRFSSKKCIRPRASGCAPSC